MAEHDEVKQETPEAAGKKQEEAASEAPKKDPVRRWTIIILGMSKPTSIITNPILSLEVTQSGFGMYIKYLMAGFLAVFAVSMAIQFTGYFLDGVADYRGDRGKRRLDSEIAAAPGD